MRATDVSDPPFALPELITTVVDLPFPPSTNTIWRNSGSRVYRSAKYTTWLDAADKLATSNFVGRNGIIPGKFTAHIGLDEDKPRRGDCDNRIKAVLDWAQSRELIANDSNCERITVEWVQRALAPHGCRLTLREVCG